MFILDVWSLNICHTIPSAFLFFIFKCSPTKFIYSEHKAFVTPAFANNDFRILESEDPKSHWFQNSVSSILSPEMLKLCHFKLRGTQDVAFSRFCDWELEYFMVRISFQKIGRKCSKCSSWFWVLVIWASSFYFIYFFLVTMCSFLVENAHLK